MLVTNKENYILISFLRCYKTSLNELGYNEHRVITNKFSGPLKNVWVSIEGARL